MDEPSTKQLRFIAVGFNRSRRHRPLRVECSIHFDNINSRQNSKNSGKIRYVFLLPFSERLTFSLTSLQDIARSTRTILLEAIECCLCVM